MNASPETRNQFSFFNSTSEVHVRATRSTHDRNPSPTTDEAITQLDSTPVLPQAELLDSPAAPLETVSEHCAANAGEAALSQFDVREAPRSSKRKMEKRRFNPHRPHVMSWANYVEGITTSDGGMSSALTR